MSATITKTKIHEDRTQERVMAHFAKDPSQAWSVKEIEAALGIKFPTASYHVRQLRLRGMLMDVGHNKYKPDPDYKSPEDIRAAVALREPRVLRAPEGSDNVAWFLGKKVPDLVVQGSWTYLKRHAESVKQRMETNAEFSYADIEAFEEICALAFNCPRETAKNS
jgi:hypothetical protein